MFERRKRIFLDSQLAGHSQVQTEPAIFCEMKKHLFSVSAGFDQRCAEESSREQFRIGSAENSFVGVQLDGNDFLFQAGVPLLAIKFHFGQFGHGQVYFEVALRATVVGAGFSDTVKKESRSASWSR